MQVFRPVLNTDFILEGLEPKIDLFKDAGIPKRNEADIYYETD